MSDMNNKDDALLERAGKLPQAVTPPRDLWAGIESQLGEQLPAEEFGSDTADVTPLRARPAATKAHWQWQAPALAASLLLALAVGYWVGQAESPALPVAGNNLTAPASQPVSLTEEVGLKEARRAMAAQIEAGLDRLPADARFVVIENLTAINAALDEIDAVLAEAPASGLDRQLLISMYTDQLARLNSMQSLVLNSNQEILL